MITQARNSGEFSSTGVEINLFTIYFYSFELSPATALVEPQLRSQRPRFGRMKTWAGSMAGSLSPKGGGPGSRSSGGPEPKKCQIFNAKSSRLARVTMGLTCTKWGETNKIRLYVGHGSGHL